MTEKQFSLVRDYVNSPDAKHEKVCGNCGSLAIKESLSVATGPISALERYCATCSRAVVKESKNRLYL
jgi:hypothetical protein